MENRKQIQLPFWGIDSCPDGWFCVGLARRSDKYDCFVARNIEEAHEQIIARGGEVALIDIPIGAPDGDMPRVCDECAKNFVGPKRKKSIFPVLCREAITAYRKESDVSIAKTQAEIAQRTVTESSLSPMGWSIVPKVVEVDKFMQGGKGRILREVHPEVCFCALNHHVSLTASKKDKAGEEERLEICRYYFPPTHVLYAEARKCHRQSTNPDDILDALAAAITAKIGYSKKYKTLPANPPKDSVGLPMEMVYVIPPSRE